MKASLRSVIVGLAVFAVAVGLGAGVKVLLPGGSDIAFAQQAAGSAEAVQVQTEQISGRQVATIVVNGVPVMRMRSSFRNLSPHNRAQIVADRLRPMVAGGLQPHEVDAARLGGAHVVRARGTSLITVMPLDASLVNSSQAGVAHVWSRNLRGALGDTYAKWPATPVEAWQAPERYSDKWVPIVSVLSGLKVGVARVNGPVSRLQYVQAVAQLETQWRDIVEVDAFVPISTAVPGRTLDRVFGCAVTGFADYAL